MALIAAGCLVSLSPGAKGNNGVMGKILQAVTSFGFRMCFTGLRVGVCIMCVCQTVSFLLTCLEEMSYQNLRPSIKLLIIHLALSLGVGGAPHGHLHGVFSPEPPCPSGPATLGHIAS